MKEIDFQKRVDATMQRTANPVRIGSDHEHNHEHNHDHETSKKKSVFRHVLFRKKKEEHAHHNHHHHDHAHEHEKKPLVTRKWQIGTVAGNAIIGAAEIATGQFSTLSVAADGFHNFGDAFTYYTQTESVLNKNHSEERKKKLRKLGYWILFGTSAAIAAKTVYDMNTEQEHATHPLTLWTASASLALNSVLASTLYRNYRKRNKNGIKDHHEHDIVKHLFTDTASATLAFGGAIAQKYGITDIESYAALSGAAITGWAFRPTRNNLEHTHDHFSEDHDHGHSHGETHELSETLKQAISPQAAKIAFAAASGKELSGQIRIKRRQKKAFIEATPETLQPYIEMANEVSLESRRRSYEGDDKSFEERNREWNSIFWNHLKSITKSEVEENTRNHRILAMRSLGIDILDDAKDVTGTLSLQVEKFRQKYVSQNGSDIGLFIKDVSEVCKHSDGSINLQLLEERVSSIESMFSAFGVTYDVHKLVKDFAIAHGMLSYSGKNGKQLATYAAEQARLQADDTDQRIRALYAMQEMRKSQEEMYIDRGINEIELYVNRKGEDLILAS